MTHELPVADDVRRRTAPPAPEPDARVGLSTFARQRRLLGLCLAVALLGLLLAHRAEVADAGGVEASLAAVLARHGLRLERESLLWLGPPVGSLRHRPALFVARHAGEPPDIWYADIQSTGGGAVLDVAFRTDVSHTSGAAEHRPLRAGHHVLYASEVDGGYAALVVLDLSGEPRAVTAGWPLRARVQNAITDLEDTGRWSGFGRRRYALSPPAKKLSAHVVDGRFVVVADGTRIVIDPRRAMPLEGAHRLEMGPTGKGMPGTITWVVDTVRKLSFVGPRPIAWLENRVYGITDFLTRGFHHVVGTNTEAEVARDLSVPTRREQARLRAALDAAGPELGWPPRPLRPQLSPAVPGEGVFIPVADEAFVRRNPNAPPALYQTFLRVNPDRDFTRVYITVWDPRQVQLHIVSGTREPESATGETGSGMVPRDARTLEHLVGAFNGGFQAMHGEFGMMAHGRVYLPPKPWAATVAVYDDGRVGMGSWLPPPPHTRDYDEAWAIAQIPAHMVSFRQNLTSVVEDGRYNPWGRWWWGAAPLEADQQTYIVRSGVCLTREGYLAYFWGESMGPEQLGKAMLATRCVRGIHLDMNSPHTGFELYRVDRAGAPRPSLPHPLTADEAQGTVSYVRGFVFRARKAVRSMTPMRFPRYIERDPRDFFYLTLEPALPGADLVVTRGSRGEGAFTTQGLPQAGWPFAFARAWLGGEAGSRTWLVRVDTRRVVPAPVRAGHGGRILGWLTGGKALAEPAAPFALYTVHAELGMRYAVGRPPEGAQVVIGGSDLSTVADAGAAIGVDGEGFLVYAERQRGEHTRLVDRMGAAGVQRAIALPTGVRLAFAVDGQTAAPDAYLRPVDTKTAMPLYADEQPATEILFPDVSPRPYSVWARMQDTRVRYFRKGPPRFTRDAAQTEPQGDGGHGARGQRR